MIFPNEDRKISLSDNVHLYILNIDNIDIELSNFIDSQIQSIVFGNRKNKDIVKAKKEISSFLQKKNNNQKMGAIAEFFVHLFLRYTQYRQECLYTNLEENSLKKGFDGFYSKNSDTWIMESKSGTINTKDISHQSKIKEAYSGLKDMLAGKTSNNPWENAYHHANNKDVNTIDEIISYLDENSENYKNQKYADINELNIIPAATIYLDDSDKIISNEIVKNNIESCYKDIKAKNIEIICITKKSINIFIEYLER
ncbi:hypothetical protein [Francisella hispaniensis]|uniref:Anti-bacteriophage protein A/HamA C-terminal domain-containing protein n=1 Tax=Francisella hispaniensis TaxID=622488 RepID=F4BGA0_9GAMM|nr:hypothetical protein [Francisella hispaniensis]AEE26494.1 hypothetical protein FN3523_1191 [Francisella hispaniensis]